MCGWSTERRINAGIGYLRQNENIFPGLTVRENLELSGWTLVTTERIVAQERILVLFEFLKDRLNDRAGLLSGGQRQALAIAMVLMHRRKLYLLDEPTAGLSPKAAGDIVERIRRFAESMPDSAVLMVEHRLELLAWVDFAVVLNQGQVVVNTQQSGGFIDSEWLSSHYF